MKGILIILIIVLITACSEQVIVQETTKDNDHKGTVIAMKHTETFNVFQRDGFKVVELKAPMVTWGGAAQGGDQTATILLVPKENTVPELSGEFSDAVVVRTPIERIAVNYGFLEAIAIELDIKDKLVAVGGVKSYDDELRVKAREGELAKIGYGWHMPPMIDPLVNARPDVMLMVMGSLEHAQHMQRINDLGIPVVPIFFEAETHYMGPVDYVRLVGMMTGKEAQADAFAMQVENNVDHLKKLVASTTHKKIISAWYGGSERWMVTVRNADNALLIDAGGINPLAQEDDIAIDDFVRVSSEVLLDKAREIDCWIIRDSHSQAFEDVNYLQNFKAWREGCLFASDGASKPEHDAFDIYATGQIRPDLLLRDIVQLLHPDLIDAPYTFIQPDTKTPRP